MRPATFSQSLPTIPHPTTSPPLNDDSHAEESVPYRLPKLTASYPATSKTSETSTDHELLCQDVLYKMNYVGCEKIDHNSTKPPAPPYTISQLRRQDNIHVPTFARVNIAPVQTQRSSEEPLRRRSARDTRSRLSTRTPQSVSRPSRLLADSPSNDKLHTAWRLSPHEHSNYDAQAIHCQTGPFSRDFTVHCATPNSWLHMKLNKSSSTSTPGGAPPPPP